MNFNLFMLDKNIISLIQSINNGEAIKKDNKDHIEMIQFLRRHDKRIYNFSYLSSAIEGRNKIKENKSQSINTVNHEANVLSSFFKKARTDGNMLKGNKYEFSEVFSKNNHLSDEIKIKAIFKKYYELREKYECKISIPKQLQEPIAFELLSYIESQGVNKENPIISIIFLKIYQLKDQNIKVDPTGVINLKKKKSIDENIHNIYSDLYIPNLIAKIEYEAKKYANFKIKFLTLDKALKSYIDIFKITIVDEIKTNQFYKNWNSIEVEITSKTIREFLKKLFEKWESHKVTIVE
jgi:hypothetical protein